MKTMTSSLPRVQNADALRLLFWKIRLSRYVHSESYNKKTRCNLTLLNHLFIYFYRDTQIYVIESEYLNLDVPVEEQNTDLS